MNQTDGVNISISPAAPNLAYYQSPENGMNEGGEASGGDTLPKVTTFDIDQQFGSSDTLNGGPQRNGHDRANTGNTDLSDMVKDQYQRMNMDENSGILKAASGSAGPASTASKRRVSFSEKPLSVELDQVRDPVQEPDGNGGLGAGMGGNRLAEPTIQQKYGIDVQQQFKLFYLNDNLSDFVLVDGDTGKNYNCHRVVLASASQLIRRFLSLTEESVQATPDAAFDASTLQKRTLELNSLTTNFLFKTPRRYVRLRISEEENIIFEQIVLRFVYANQSFESVKMLITPKRAASVLDLAMALEIDLLFQMTLVHLCEEILPNTNTLFNFDHALMELVFKYIDKQGPQWDNFQKQIVDRLAAKFEDLQNFTELEKLPARAFNKLIQSGNLHVGEEYQVVHIVDQYIRSTERNTEALKAAEA